MERTKVIFEVVWSLPDGEPDNVSRFSNRHQAVSFASLNRHYQAPASVSAVVVPVSIARRWGL
jgi:hypothetical protein